MIPDLLQYFKNDFRNFPKSTKKRQHLDLRTPYLLQKNFKNTKKGGTSFANVIFHVRGYENLKILESLSTVWGGDSFGYLLFCQFG